MTVWKHDFEATNANRLKFIKQPKGSGGKKQADFWSIKQSGKSQKFWEMPCPSSKLQDEC